MGGLIDSFGNELGTMFGANPNSNGANTVAQSANLIQPVTQGQVNSAANTTSQGIQTEQDLINALAGQASAGANTQNNLTSQLTNEANGVGPNPVQAALAQQTGNNISNQAALQAGQRGSNANVGLIARQVGQQGAGIQQNAIGQAATLGAQQQIAAQNQLQNLAASQVGQGQTAANSFNNVALTNQNQLLGALGGYNTNQVQNVAAQNTPNASIANTNANNANTNVNGLISKAGQGLASFLNKGGEAGVDGKEEANSVLAKVLSKKKMPDHMRAMAEIYHPKVLKMADGGDTDAYLQEKSQDIEELLPLLAANEGAVVPGKPQVNKNSLKNDVVPAMLTPKEIVLPLSVTQSKDAPAAAAKFVAEIKAKENGGKMNGDFKEALRAHVKNRKNKA